MSDGSPQSVTVLLAALRDGDHSAYERLLPVVYGELRRIARARMSGLPAGQTLQATALVHEVYLKLVGTERGAGPGWESRAHFFGTAARAMRNILVDRARRRATEKHGGRSAREDRDPDECIEFESPQADILSINQALTQLEQSDPRAHQIVMLRFFAGLSEEQTAELLGESVRSLRREWTYARAWLHRAMGGDIK